MEKIKRQVNQKLVYALMAYGKLTGHDLARKCEPPVSRSGIHYLLTGRNQSTNLTRQVSDILQPVALEMASELGANGVFADVDMVDVLFPVEGAPNQEVSR